MENFELGCVLVGILLVWPEVCKLIADIAKGK